MPTTPVRTTVIVVTWRGAEHIGECLDALAAQRRDHRVLVVDNASDDGTAALLATHPSAPATVRLPRNTGYAGGVAAGLANVGTPFVAWLNDDACPDPEWLAALEGELRADTAAVAAALHRPDGAVQSRGVALTTDGYGYDVVSGAYAPFAFCGGAALLRVDALRAVGGVPAAFFCYYEDTDTAWRLRLAGWRIGTARGATVHHRHGASSAIGSARFHRWNERNRLLMLLRCAPGRVAVARFAHFAALTLVLVVRRGGGNPAPNFRAGLRLRVVGEVLLTLPRTLSQRRGIRELARVERGTVWRQWAGR